MVHWFNQTFPNVIKFSDLFIKSIFDTLKMLGYAGFYSFIFGIIFGTILVITRKHGLKENKIVNWILSQIVNILRAIPFLILLVFLKPITRFVSGTTVEVEGVIFPLIIGATPFFIRQVELALSDVNEGLIEAAQSMGLSTLQIITKVYWKESIPALTRSLSITLISLLGLTALGGAVGGGGIGAMVLTYGHNRNLPDITNLAVLVILLIVLIIQTSSNYIIKKTSH